MRITTPAKLILSGEHAVVYNHTALTMTLKYFTHCDIEVNSQLYNQQQPGIILSVPFFNYHQHKTWQELINLAISIQHNYQKFTDGELPIQHVLNQPIDLCWFSIITVLQHAYPQPEKYYTKQLTLELTSEIPIGSGMGSSASIILTLMHSLNELLNINLCEHTIYQLALQAENLQHGYSSGIDLLTIINQGINYFTRDNTGAQQHYFDLTVPKTHLAQLYLINTGKPLSTTGDCTAAVRKNFGRADHKIWQDFTECTTALKHYLTDQNNNTAFITQTIQKNHQLLQQLGVVPKAICQFIKQIEATQGAAKICGAGSLTGDAAGMVLAAGDYHTIKQLCDQQQFTIDHLANKIM